MRLAVCVHYCLLPLLQVLEDYSICGGLSSSAAANATISGSCCAASSECAYQSEWYWQCKPVSKVSPECKGQLVSIVKRTLHVQG